MKVEIDYTRCEGHAVCVKVSPSVFEIEDDDEQVRLSTDTPDETAQPSVVLAAKQCPTNAIRLSD